MLAAASASRGSVSLSAWHQQMEQNRASRGLSDAHNAGHRLFHYQLPRRSYRQEKWLDFDGVVGYLELEVTSGMPFARAAETLHFGQKATFGLGRIRVLVLE